MFKMVHENYNVFDLDRSLAFYKEALHLVEKRRKESEEFIIVYIGNDESDFELELTYLKDRHETYDLGEGEFHLAFAVEDMDKAYQLHQEMGCVCFVNEKMGIYFIEDPDGYWLEIVPAK